LSYPAVNIKYLSNNTIPLNIIHVTVYKLMSPHKPARLCRRAYVLLVLHVSPVIRQPVDGSQRAFALTPSIK